MGIEFSFTDDDSGLACYCGAAVTFTTNSGFTLSQVDLKLQDGTGTPDVTINVDLYSVDINSKPNVLLYGIGTINQDVLTGSRTWHEFTGLSYVLSSSTEYAIVCDVDNKDGTSNFIWARGNASYTDGTNWNREYFIGPGCQPYAEASDTWNFRAYSSGAAPTKATNPSPANAGTDIDFSGLQLSWDDGGNADTFDVYMGETGNLTAVSAAQVGTTYTTTMAELGTIFGVAVGVPIDQVVYWRIDSTNTSGTTTGDEWSFDARPIKASNPFPVDTATNAAVSFAFAWTGSGIAATYNTLADVGLGLVSQSTGLESATWTANPNIFGYVTTYTWRVDSVNTFGTTTGDEWTFTTLRFDPLTKTYFYPTTGQYYRLLIQSDGTYGDPPGVGTENTDFVYLAAGYEANFVATNRRLVAAAENRIWFENI